MIQTLMQNWWLLALCGVLEAIYAATNLVMQSPDGPLTLRTFVPRGTVVHMGMLALTAGAFTIAAGICGSRKGRPWLLALNGLALSALGLLSIFWTTRRLSFRTVALVLVVMAMSIGILELVTAMNLRRHVADEWFLALAGAVSVGFGLTFFGMAFDWIKPERPESIFVWLSAYFGFSAMCMLALGLRLNSLRAAIHRMARGALLVG